MCGGPMQSKSDDDWRAESDHRTLADASTIQSDKKRMASVKKHHRKVSKQHAAMGRSMLKGRR